MPVLLDLAENVVAVPLRMPRILKSSSPASPSCNPEITGTPPRHGRAKLDLLLHPTRQGDQLRTATRDQLLVGGDHRFA